MEDENLFQKETETSDEVNTKVENQIEENEKERQQNRII